MTKKKEILGTKNLTQFITLVDGEGHDAYDSYEDALAGATEVAADGCPIAIYKKVALLHRYEKVVVTKYK